MPKDFLKVLLLKYENLRNANIYIYDFSFFFFLHVALCMRSIHCRFCYLRMPEKENSIGDANGSQYKNRNVNHLKLRLRTEFKPIDKYMNKT